MIRWVHSPRYAVDVGAHTFPTVKFKLVAEKLVELGALREADRVEPTAPSRDDLRLVHAADWVERVLGGRMTLADELRAELPWSKPLAEAHALAVSGTLAAAKSAWLQQREQGRASDAATVAAFASQAMTGRTMAFEQKLDDTVRALTLEQVNAALKKHISLSKISAVKAGDFKNKPPTPPPTKP